MSCVEDLKKFREISLRDLDAVTNLDALRAQYDQRPSKTREDFLDFWAAKKLFDKTLVETATERDAQNFVARPHITNPTGLQQPRAISIPAKSEIKANQSHTNRSMRTSASPVRRDQPGTRPQKEEDIRCVPKLSFDSMSRKRSAIHLSPSDTISIAEVENEDMPPIAVVENEHARSVENNCDDEDGKNYTRGDADENVDEDDITSISETESSTAPTLYDESADDEIVATEASHEKYFYCGSSSSDDEKQTENGADEETASETSFVVPDSEEVLVYDSAEVPCVAEIICESKETRAARKLKIDDMPTAIKYALKGDLRHAKMVIEENFIFNQARISFGANLKEHRDVLHDLVSTAAERRIATVRRKPRATKKCFLCLTLKQCSVDVVFGDNDKRSCGADCSEKLRAILNAYNFLRTLKNAHEYGRTDPTILMELWDVVESQFDNLLLLKDEKAALVHNEFLITDHES